MYTVMKLYSIPAILLSVIFFSALPVQAQTSFETIATFSADEAFQAVAVGSDHFYAIASRAIGKYDKKTGKKIDEWKEQSDGPILHLDSGVIVDGKLYAAHSNYPEIPMTSSVEIWDTETLDHIGSHSFGIDRGSLTWVDRHDGYWWGVFAHYDEFEDKIGKDNSWTTLVKFDDQWNAVESWIYPQQLLERFDGKSNSGGSWGPDGQLYITGHDRAELYKIKLPDSGSVLELDQIVPIENEGQGIAWDRSEDNIIYAIKRSTREVVVSQKRK